MSVVGPHFEGMRDVGEKGNYEIQEAEGPFGRNTSHSESIPV